MKKGAESRVANKGKKKEGGMPFKILFLLAFVIPLAMLLAITIWQNSINIFKLGRYKKNKN